MSFKPDIILPSNSIAGNPSISDFAFAQGILPDGTLSLSGGILNAFPTSGNSTTGNYTLQNIDYEKGLITTDSTAVTYSLPVGLLSGFYVISYQGGAGTITYSPMSGATLVNTGTIRSGGLMTAGYYARIENIGNDTWVITGSL